MKDYIKEGFERGIAPPLIYDRICKALENPELTEAERTELLVQKDKAEKLAIRTKDIFKFEPRK